MLKLFAIFIVLLMPGWAGSTKKGTYALEQISVVDKTDLDSFFRLLIQNHEFGYTLFGSKPITVYNFFKMSNDYSSMQQCLVFEKGWAAWLKNQHLFPSEKFVFKKEERKRSAEFVDLYLINKQQVLREIYQHLDLFKEHLGETISPELVLERLCSEEPIHNILTSQVLWGIFLGYGEKNARAFEKESDVLKAIGCKMFPPFSIEKESNSLLCESTHKLIQNMRSHPRFLLPQNKKLLLSCLSELSHLIGARQTFKLSAHSVLDQFGSPTFIYWDKEETQALYESYSKTKNELIRAYAEGSFLETTINQWCSSR
jgi:hypothetical protein